MLVTLLGILIEVSERHSSKVPLLIDVTLLGILIEVSDMHL